MDGLEEQAPRASGDAAMTTATTAVRRVRREVGWKMVMEELLT